MRRKIQYFLGLLVTALIIVGPLAYSQQRKSRMRNFRVVEEGKLYRSGQLNEAGLKSVIHDYQIRTVISLRYADREGDRPPDWKEEERCLAMGLNYIRVRPRQWMSEDERQPPAQQSVDEFLAVMDKQKHYPILLHCYAGMHRTGAFCAIYRMEYQGWTNAEAMAELKALGYANLDKEEDVSGFLENYVPRRLRKKP